MREKLSRAVVGPGQQLLQIVHGSGDRVTTAVSDSSTAEIALPSNARLIEVRSTEPVWLRFGNTGVGAAAADDDSILFPAGEKVMPVPVDAAYVPYDYFRVLSASGDAGSFQIEAVPVASPSP